MIQLGLALWYFWLAVTAIPNLVRYVRQARELRALSRACGVEPGWWEFWWPAILQAAGIFLLTVGGTGLWLGYD